MREKVINYLCISVLNGVSYMVRNDTSLYVFCIGTIYRYILYKKYAHYDRFSFDDVRYNQHISELT